MNRPIAINGRFLTQRLTGVQRHAIETVRALDALLAARDPLSRPHCELMVPRGHSWTHGPLSVIAIREVGRRQGQAWEQFELPFLVPRGAVLLNLCNTYPMLARRPVVTVHDAAPFAAPEGFTGAFRLWYRILFNMLRLRRKVPLMTDSWFSATEFERFVGLPTSRLSVVHCGADHWSRVSPDRSVLDKLGVRAGSYVLGVASENPNKNLRRLVESFGRVEARGDLRLVLVGGRNSRVFQDSGGIDPPWVLRAGHISDSELAGLYSEALCFAFPSLYEGFGLPPLEAMTFGCPVLSSRDASLPEVCGDAAEYCDARNCLDIARGLSAVITDVARRDDLIARGRARVANFTWRSTAMGVLHAANQYPST